MGWDNDIPVVRKAGGWNNDIPVGKPASKRTPPAAAPAAVPAAAPRASAPAAAPRASAPAAAPARAAATVAPDDPFVFLETPQLQSLGGTNWAGHVGDVLRNPHATPYERAWVRELRRRNLLSSAVLEVASGVRPADVPKPVMENWRRILADVNPIYALTSPEASLISGPADVPKSVKDSWRSFWLPAVSPINSIASDPGFSAALAAPKSAVLATVEPFMARTALENAERARHPRQMSDAEAAIMRVLGGSRSPSAQQPDLPQSDVDYLQRLADMSWTDRYSAISQAGGLTDLTPARKQLNIEATKRQFGDTLGGIVAGLSHFTTEMVTDPLTYLGGGALSGEKSVAKSLLGRAGGAAIASQMIPSAVQNIAAGRQSGDTYQTTMGVLEGLMGGMSGLHASGIDVSRLAGKGIGAARDWRRNFTSGLDAHGDVTPAQFKSMLGLTAQELLDSAASAAQRAARLEARAQEARGYDAKVHARATELLRGMRDTIEQEIAQGADAGAARQKAAREALAQARKEVGSIGKEEGVQGGEEVASGGESSEMTALPNAWSLNMHARGRLALSMIDHAERMGHTTPGAAMMMRHFIANGGMSVDLDTSLRYVDAVHRATAQIIADHGGDPNVSYDIVGETSTAALQNDLLHTTISLFRGHDAHTVVEEWYHRYYDRLSADERAAYEAYHAESGDTRSASEHFGMEGSTFFFMKKMHEGVSPIRALFADARRSLLRLVGEIRVLRGRQLPQQIEAMYRAAGESDIPARPREVSPVVESVAGDTAGPTGEPAALTPVVAPAAETVAALSEPDHSVDANNMGAGTPVVEPAPAAEPAPVVGKKRGSRAKGAVAVAEPVVEPVAEPVAEPAAVVGKKRGSRAKGAVAVAEPVAEPVTAPGVETAADVGPDVSKSQALRPSEDATKLPENRSTAPSSAGHVRVGSLELYELAVTLGLKMDTKNLPKSYGTFDPKTGRILIDKNRFQDPDYAAATIAHEIGHGLDWMDDHNIQRGNVLGHIGALKRHLLSTLDVIPTDPSRMIRKSDRAALRRSAELQVGPMGDEEPAIWRQEVRRVYNEMLAQEITARNLVTHSEIRDELIALSDWWRPLPEGATDAYIARRHTAAELYADAISVLLNHPAELEQRAPTTNAMILDYMKRRPVAKKAFDTIQQIIGGGHLDEHRAQRVQEMFARGEVKMREAQQAAENAGRRPFVEAMSQLFFNQQQPISKLERSMGLTGHERSGTAAWEDLQHRENANRVLLEDIDADVVAPLHDADVTYTAENGAKVHPVEVLGEYVFQKRIAAGDRTTPREVTVSDGVDEHGNEVTHVETVDDQIANPLNNTVDTATAALAHLREKLGEHKWAVLEESDRIWREKLKEANERAIKSGLFSEEQAKLIRDNADSYAHFAVVDYMTGRLSAMLKHQTGTLKDVGNAFVMTTLKAMQLNRATAFQEARTEILVKVMEGRGWVKRLPVRRGPGGHIVEPRPAEGKAIITHFENGRPVFFETEKYVADMFNSDQLGALAGVVDKARGVNYGIFGKAFTVWSDAFQAMNFVRDIERTGRNLGYRGLASAYGRTFKHAVGYMRTGTDPLIREMLKDNALSPTLYRMFDVDWENPQYDRELQRYGLMDKNDQPTSKLKLGVGRVLDAIRTVGEGSEIWSKAAAYEMLGQRGITGKERAYKVRNYASTPPSTRHGIASAPVEAVSMFSRIAGQGWIADAEVASNPATRAGFWLRTFALVGIPYLATQAALHGAFGDRTKEMLERIPSRDRMAYTCIPVGEALGKDGKVQTVYIRIPMDETSRVVKMVAANLLQKDAPGAVKSLVDQMPGVSPPIKMAGAWAAYAGGGNPQDAFRDKPIIGSDEQAARGYAGQPGENALQVWSKGSMPAVSDMMNWTADQFGVFSQVKNLVHRPWYKRDTADTPVGNIASKVPFVRALIRSSGYGEAERDADMIRRADALSATERLKRSPEERRNALDVAKDRRLRAAERKVER